MAKLLFRLLADDNELADGKHDLCRHLILCRQLADGKEPADGKGLFCHLPFLCRLLLGS